MNPRILIVEDNAMMRSFLSYFLGNNHEIIQTSSAEEALLWLKEQNLPDLIICDYELGEMSGVELLENLKASGIYKHIPFLILSGKSKSEYRIKCLEKGAIDFIIKPFNPQELELKVKRFLQEKKQAFQ